MKNKHIITALTIVSIILYVSSCQGFSRSGRSKIIAMAKKESKKRRTIPKPNTIKKTVIPKPIKIKDIVTAKEKEQINNELNKKKIPPAKGKLIQIEGLVLREVTELTIKLNTSHSQLDQLIAMQKHVKKNWHYIFDPKSNSDTFRSAEATIALKYNGKYSGDCDDFAILMASFARQVGLDSRVLGGYSEGSGHAFAEVFIPTEFKDSPFIKGFDYRIDKGKWVSLDWFKGNKHNKYINDIHIFKDL